MRNCHSSRNSSGAPELAPIKAEKYRDYSRRIADCLAIYRACSKALENGVHKPVKINYKIKPSRCGAIKTLGSPRKGKKEDYEIPLPPCMRCHIIVYKDRTEVHVDSISPRCDPFIHLAVDATKIFTAGTAFLALLVAWLLGTGASSVLLAALTAYIWGKTF